MNILICLVITCFSQTSFAAKWMLVDIETNRKYVHLINISNAKVNNGYALFWHARVNIDESEKHDMTMAHFQANCLTFEYRDMNFSFYLQGKKLWEDPSLSKLSHAKKGKIIRRAIESVCNKNYNPDFTFESINAEDLTNRGLGILNFINSEISKTQGNPF